MAGRPDQPAGALPLVGPAQLTPYLEQTAVYNALDLTVPLYGGGAVQPQVIPFPRNRGPLAAVVKPFLCPADEFRVVKPDQGPSNYVACVGANADGDAALGDGLFYQNSKVRPADVTDGLSNTVAFAESLLGAGGPNQAGATGDARLFYKQVTALGPAACDSSTTLVADRGALWADGAYNCRLYNHLLPPNSPTMDCVRHSNPAYKAARSRHAGGVSAALADGSVRFVRDAVEPGAWRAAATRAGGEVANDF